MDGNVTRKVPLQKLDPSPRPVRAEWDKALADMKPWLSPERFEEAKEIHWRIFERANRWHKPG